ncbi:MAG: hypothetical protein HRU07_00155 [Nitrosopumilus sp.]|nr:hypothetical protein [Nitrosopumilus sp.]NRA04593.1 hypothetical protein [Nitrosopumilus sp.]
MPEDGESQEFSLSESVRSFIQQAFDNKIDLSVPSNRKEMIKQFKEAYPKEKQSTIDPIFSREIPKIAKSYGVNLDDVKKTPAKKYSKNNEINVNATEKKSGVKTVGIKNPGIVNKDGDGKPVIGGIGQPVQYKYEIKSSQLSAFSNSFYSLFQVFSEDLEDLTESESADLGDLWQPVAQQKLGNSDRGQAALAVGGTFEIMARKTKKAKENRKLRKEKESKERGTTLEPNRDPEVKK